MSALKAELAKLSAAGTSDNKELVDRKSQCSKSSESLSYNVSQEDLQEQIDGLVTRKSTNKSAKSTPLEFTSK